MAPTTIRLGLDAMRAVCDVLGQPQTQVPTVLVAGTNGKGSTATMLGSIGRAAGLRTGLYLSPALGDAEEQIQLNGQGLDPSTHLELTAEVERAASSAGQPLTEFETATAAAFLAFSRAELDLAIVEVGLGGARDATNIAEPVVSVLTTVDLDHQQYLGQTLAAIAKEKAGVFRHRRSAVLGFLRRPALRAARQEAEAIGARCIAARSHIEDLDDRDGQLRVQTRRAEYGVRLGLAGEHQGRNAALAILAAEALRPRFPSLDTDAICRGLANARCPGRLESLVRGGHHFLLDAAHNPAAAAVLAHHLSVENLRPDLLFGAFRDKDAEGMLELLRPRVGRLILTPIEHPRTWTPADYAANFGGELVTTPAGGLSEVRLKVPLLISGSMRLVGDVRRQLLGPAIRHAATG
ncbi:MAG: Mur ligase family protein [Acidobacteriota bacterium]